MYIYENITLAHREEGGGQDGPKKKCKVFERSLKFIKFEISARFLLGEALYLFLNLVINSDCWPWTEIGKNVLFNLTSDELNCIQMSEFINYE